VGSIALNVLGAIDKGIEIHSLSRDDLNAASADRRVVGHAATIHDHFAAVEDVEAEGVVAEGGAGNVRDLTVADGCHCPGLLMRNPVCTRPGAPLRRRSLC
jgi:hypothetical protein